MKNWDSTSEMRSIRRPALWLNTQPQIEWKCTDELNITKSVVDYKTFSDIAIRIKITTITMIAVIVMTTMVIKEDTTCICTTCIDKDTTSFSFDCI